MATNKYTAEQIISKLREAEVLLAKQISVSQASEQFGVVEQTLGDEVLKRKIFYTLEENKVIIEQWSQEYNQNRPHSSLGYRSPAPETVVPWMVPVVGRSTPRYSIAPPRGKHGMTSPTKTINVRRSNSREQNRIRNLLSELRPRR